MSTKFSFEEKTAAEIIKLFAGEKYEIRAVDDRKVWEEFLATRSEVSFLQSWSWGEFHLRMKNRIWRFGFFELGSKKPVGVMLAITEKAKRGQYLTVPGGPIIDWLNHDLVDLAFKLMEAIAKKEKDVFVRIRPQVEETNESIEFFRQMGCKKAPMHLHAELTHRLDLEKSEEELLAKMRKNTRYEIRKAAKIGVKVTTTTNKKAIQRFYEAQMETARRQKFLPFSEKYLTEQFDEFVNNDEALLYEAEYEGELLAQAMIIFYGQEAVYHYGASTEAGRKYPGAYLVQWEAIKEAQKRGMKYYNFWGVAPEGESEHRFAGLSLFKRGFGGEDYAYLHAQDLIIDKVRYALVEAIEVARKKIRRV